MVIPQQHKDSVLAQSCGISDAVEIVGERWSFLILRGAFNGLHHFEEFQATLGIARNILSNRLSRLVEHGLLQRDPDPADRRKVIYRLTIKGRELLPALIALRQWGERWISGVPNNPVLVDRHNRRPVAPIRVLSEDGRPLSLAELAWVDRSEITESNHPASPGRSSGSGSPPPTGGEHDG